MDVDSLTLPHQCSNIGAQHRLCYKFCSVRKQHYVLKLSVDYLVCKPGKSVQPGRQSILSPAAAAAADAALEAPLAADAAAAAALEPPPEAAEEDAAACRSFRLLLMSHSAPTRCSQGVAEQGILTYKQHGYQRV